jgi:hypothetical protein
VKKGTEVGQGPEPLTGAYRHIPKELQYYLKVHFKSDVLTPGSIYSLYFKIHIFNILKYIFLIF